jgi:hypothetical protein
LTGILVLACPSCGMNLSVNGQARWLRCDHCQVEHMVKQVDSLPILAPLEAELDRIQESATRKTALSAIRKLNIEILDLQTELDGITREGTPLDTTRILGVCAIVLGLAYLLIFGALPLAGLGVGLGILLHASTEVIGRGYYLHKSYLKRLIFQKQVQVFEYEQVFFLLNQKKLHT